MENWNKSINGWRRITTDGHWYGIFELSSPTKEGQIKTARHTEEVNESIEFINEKFYKMEVDKKEKKMKR